MTINRFNHIALGAARIGHNGMGRQDGGKGGKHLRHLPDRGGDQHHVCVFDRVGKVGFGAVNHPQTHGEGEIVWRPPHPDHFADTACPFHFQRERATNQPYADHH